MSEKASSSSTPVDKTPTPSASGNGSVEIDKLLSREANAFQRELEVERILVAFKLKYVPHPPLSFPSRRF